MPIYDYKCSDCEHEIEIIQKFSDEPKTLCPKCNKESLLKMVSAPSFRLKGGGWYETDFKTGNKFLSIPISTGMDITRNALISYNCDIGVAISGAYGTLSEIAFTLAQEKQLIAYNSWDIPKSIQVETIDSLIEEADKCLKL